MHQSKAAVSAWHCKTYLFPPWQALQQCQHMAKREVERNAVQVLAALAAPDWTEAVVGTAAALTAEAALAACITTLVTRVRCFTQVLPMKRAPGSAACFCRFCFGGAGAIGPPHTVPGGRAAAVSGTLTAGKRPAQCGSVFLRSMQQQASSRHGESPARARPERSGATSAVVSPGQYCLRESVPFGHLYPGHV